MTTTQTKPAKKRLGTRTAASEPAITADLVEDVELGNPERLQAQLEAIRSDLEQAEQAEQDAQSAHALASGRAILGELSSDEVAEHSAAWSAAQGKTSALRAALRLLEQRRTAADAQAESERVSALRNQSDAAHRAQYAALGAIARASADLVLALQDERAESAMVDGIHAQLAAADPDRAAEVAEDHRLALASLGASYAARRAAVHEAAQRARSGLQHSDGSSPRLDAPLVLLGDQIAPEGLSHYDAMPLVTDWEVATLAKLDDQERDGIEDEYQELASRTLVSGLGHLSASQSEVRRAAALDPALLSPLLPTRTRIALAGLTGYLPASATEGISVRTVPRSVLEARQNESRLQEGRAALMVLVN